MDNEWAGPPLDTSDFQPASAGMALHPCAMHADDPLGDEGAFPATWQTLDRADVPFA